MNARCYTIGSRPQKYVSIPSFVLRACDCILKTLCMYSQTVGSFRLLWYLVLAQHTFPSPDYKELYSDFYNVTKRKKKTYRITNYNVKHML